MMETREDIVEEARRLMEAAMREDVPVRLIGGLAIRLRVDGPVHPGLARDYEDIDLVTHRKGGKATTELLMRMGYVANERFNSMNAGRRMVFYDVPRERQIDVFIGDFEMCHKLALAERIALEPHTVPLAELLLTKLQIVQLNRKDVTDIATILLEHDLAEHDGECVNAAFVARTLSGDWGLWRTVRGSVETTRTIVGELPLSAEERQRIGDRLDRLWARVEAEPKSLRWRSRAKVGERARWYQEPEEIAHDRTGGAGQV
jgi:hypothetical protein